MRHYLIFALAIFLVIYLFRLSSVPKLHIPENQPIKIIATVTNQPYLKDSYQIISLGQIRVKTTPFPKYIYGQRLKIIGTFSPQVTSPFTTNYFSNYPTISEIDSEEAMSRFSQLKRTFINTRGYFETKMSRLLPEPQSALLQGIWFGSKKQLPEDFLQKLQQTGTIHLVVASGQNVAFVAILALELSLLFFSRRLAILISLVFIFGYVLLTGAEAPVVRAGIMSTFSFLAQFFGRPKKELLGLFLAGGIMLLISPLLLFDLSFQLSFAATLGIIVLNPQFNKIVKFTPLTTALSAQCLTLPIIAYSFGTFSWLSLPTNVLVEPVVPSVMVFGFLITIASLIFLPLAQALAWLVYPLLTWFIFVVENANSLI